MSDTQPLYNSRLLKVYLEYLQKEYPNINQDSLLKEIGIDKYKIDDPAHWFTQSQANRFYDVVVQQTGEPNIARYAGRYVTESKGFGATKQYVLGLMTPVSIYLMMDKLYPLLSRGSDAKTKKIGPNKVEMISTPKLGVAEQRYQCENRIGVYEGLGKVFTDKFAKIEHPECFHNGDDCCRYIVSWQQSSAHFWKMLRNYFLLFTILACTILIFFAFNYSTWSFVLLMGAFLTSLLSYNFERLENKTLRKTIENQKEAAEENLLESNIRYNNALLIQEIGQATSQILDIDMIIKTVAMILHRRLDFDRGMIMMVDKKNNRLVYKGGYGHTEREWELLRTTEFHLDNPDSKGLFVKALRERKPFLIRNLNDIMDNLSKRSRELAQQMGGQSLICVPLVYEKEALGILTVDNGKSNITLRESDMNLLMGVASATAISIINAASFKKIKESESQYRLLADNISDVIWILDIPGAIYSYISPSVQQMYGWTPDEFMNLPLEQILPAQSIDLARSIISKELVKEKIHGVDPMRSRILELEQFCKDGSKIWVEVTARFLRGPNSRVTGILGVSRDITERKKSENEKTALELQLRHAHRMEAVGTMAGGIAHDFNNILSAIIGYTELALTDSNETMLRKKLEEVLKAGNRARELIRQILAFSRQADQKMHPVQIKLIVKEALNLVRASTPSTIKIVQNIVSESAVMADPTQIHQILMNLCTNAQQAMNEKGGTLEISLTDVELNREFTVNHPGITPGPYLCLMVSDTGHGIPADIMPRLFDPFFTTKKQGEGTGLGLAVVHGIVKSHGGEIIVRSEPGKGSFFSVFLPVCEVSADFETINNKEAAPTGNERVLFIDDEISIMDLGMQVLKQLGYHVEARASSIAALELFRDQPDRFDLVITDMTMPNMTGLQLAKEMLRIRPNIPIILCTGFSHTVNEEKAKEIGIKEFIMKPISIGEIARIIRRVLDT